MVPESPLVTVAVGLGIALLGHLIRSRGWTFLIAGVRRDLLPFPGWAGEVVGVHAIFVGVLVAALGLVEAAGASGGVPRTVVGVLVVVTTVGIPFWGPRYLAWRAGRGDLDDGLGGRIRGKDT